jgi:hypothetical protein
MVVAHKLNQDSADPAGGKTNSSSYGRDYAHRKSRPLNSQEAVATKFPSDHLFLNNLIKEYNELVGIVFIISS